MFNKHQFGRLKFNTVISSSQNTANVNFELKIQVQSNIYLNPNIQRAVFILNTKGKDEVTIFSSDTKSIIQLKTIGSSFNNVYPSKSNSNLVLNILGKAPSRKIFAGDTLSSFNVEVLSKSLRKLFPNESSGNLKLGVVANPSRILFLSPVEIDFYLKTKANHIVNIYPLTKHIKFIMNTFGASNMYGYAVLELPKLILKPNSELVIDTEEMTVVLDGQDVTRYFGDYSEFFNLLSNENILIYEDDSSKRELLYKVLWKDRWL